MADASVVVCPVCGEGAPGFAPGPGGRPGASCVTCRSLERHRFLVLLLAAAVADRARDTRIVDVAPSRQISPFLRQISPQGYVSIDFDPDADGRLVDLVASLTDLPFDDDSVGLLVCYHVLEHIPDDRRAMSEIARTLAPDGLAIVQVPWRRDSVTDEEPDAPVEERVRRFGQADHVRYYGGDFVDRLEAAGLSVRELQPRHVADEALLPLLGIRGDESVWFCATDPAALPDLTRLREQVRIWTATAIAGTVAGAGRGDLAGVTQADLDRLVAARAKARARARYWKREYTRLRQRRAVRMMAAVSRPFRSGQGRPSAR